MHSKSGEDWPEHRQVACPPEACLLRANLRTQRCPLVPCCQSCVEAVPQSRLGKGGHVSCSPEVTLHVNSREVETGQKGHTLPMLTKSHAGMLRTFQLSVMLSQRSCGAGGPAAPTYPRCQLFLSLAYKPGQTHHRAVP